MRFASRPLAIALFAFTLFAADARALTFYVESDDADAGSAKVVADTQAIDFGSAEIGGTSKTITVTFTNDDSVLSTSITAFVSTDQAVRFLNEKITYPILLAPGEDFQLSLAYANESLMTTAIGDLKATFTIPIGTEDLIIPFIVRGVAEGGLRKRPGEGLFLGPCFLGTLMER